MTDLDSSTLAVLTLAELNDHLRGRLEVPRSAKQRKAGVIEWVVAHADTELTADLVTACQEKHHNREEAAIMRKRKRDEVLRIQRKSRRIERIDHSVEHDPRKYLNLATEAQLHQCFQEFIDATSNSAMKHLVCAVCAREVSALQDNVQTLRSEDIPHCHRLIPSIPHDAHDLYNGMLLEPSGVFIREEDHEECVNVCGDCAKSLAMNVSTPPPMSLANNLWIGRIPWELARLTVPEQLLVSLLHPRVFVFKLFPRDKDVRPEDASLQRAMRGNISTYEQDVAGVAAMVQGRLMPRPASILSSIITITYIGKDVLRKAWLQRTFRVRREVVRQALLWLKRENPKYYGHIDIDERRLELLPEDDVPPEIMDVVRQTTDVGLVDQESAGYVPTDEESNGFPMPQDEGNGGTRGDVTDDPDVIPFQVSGSIDTDLTNLTGNDLMMWGLANLWNKGEEGGYAVRHGSQAVRDLPPLRQETGASLDPGSQRNYFEMAFPCLFPYGTGGVELPRTIAVPFVTHVRWLLQYFDRRFRRHETLPFVAFGILQKRAALQHAHVQIRRKDFERDGRVMASLTAAQLEAARQQEEKGIPITDPAVCILRKHVHATAGRVMGTDQSRYNLRSEIRATGLEHGPPSIWSTWNPSDMNCPLAQVLCGEDIDLDKFDATLGPDKNQRAKNVASDPYAAAKFFHFTVQTILETLAQVKASKFQVEGAPGIFGEVAAYFGTVEAQGRGTLHLHILIWLKNTPTADELKDLFKEETFQSKNHQGNTHRSQYWVLRPPDPCSPTYRNDVDELELRLARSLQVHTCKVRRCLRPNKHGQQECKRKAPWKCADDDFVRETGEWGPKRTCGYVNGWHPAILVNGRCNNDCKLLTNGAETKNITFYVTGYAAKKQGRNFNTSAILADTYAYHQNHPNPNYVDELRDNQRLLLFRLVHRINREQELSAAMVISYLMAWGDVYRSHRYTSVYWSSFVTSLLKAFPGLDKADASSTQAVVALDTAVEQLERGDEPTVDKAAGEVEGLLASALQTPEAVENEDNDFVTLNVNSTGRLYAKNQVTDYQLRGEELNDYSVYDFFMHTYETRLPSASRQAHSSTLADDELDEQVGADEYDPTSEPTPRTTGDDEQEAIDQPRKLGRERNTRSQYHCDHPAAKSKHRMVRSPLHRNLVNFVGRFFPSRADATVKPFYCASMLLLLKPWRDPQRDLKHIEETWTAAFDEFMRNSSPKVHRLVANIEYPHECRVAADLARAESDIPTDDVVSPGVMPGLDDLALGEGAAVDVGGRTITEESITEIYEKLTPHTEVNHARQAIEIAKGMRIFNRHMSEWTVAGEGMANAVGGDIVNLSMWKEQMKKDVLAQNAEEDPPATSSTSSASTATITQLTAGPASLTSGIMGAAVVPSIAAVGVMTGVHPSILRDDQFRAFDVIRWHLDETLADRNPPPLRMVLYGEGGTGKSKVIQTVTEAFAQRGVKYMLAKTAYTGVAASLIDGKTINTLMSIPVRANGAAMSDRVKTRVQAAWKHKRYLIVDEYSMIPKSLLQAMEKHVSIGKAGSTSYREECTFGGVNVILCGDLHQFPPVAKGKAECLFTQQDAVNDTEHSALGRRIYEEFTTVVVLKEQMRVTDPVWRDVLVHLRRGEMEARHLEVLRSLVLTTSNTGVNFANGPWTEASLVTPRHAVRQKWNQESARKFAADGQQVVFICSAEDTVKQGKDRSQALSVAERYAVACRAAGGKVQQRKNLPREVEIFVGMSVLVTNNLETDLDLTNGARGEIVGITLDADEPPRPAGGVVRLQKLPAYILVKMARTRASQLAGLAPAVIPVEAVSTTFSIKLHTRTGSTFQRTVHRRQFPVTPAYAFTDYRSQGQTLPYVIVDIATPPSGTLNLFNLYVALSRSSGRDTIRLLRDFNDRLFLQSHDPALPLEDERLEALDRITKAWWTQMGGEERMIAMRAAEATRVNEA